MLYTKEMLVSPSKELFSSDRPAENEALARRMLARLFKNCQYRKRSFSPWGKERLIVWHRRKTDV